MNCRFFLLFFLTGILLTSCAVKPLKKEEVKERTQLLRGKLSSFNERINTLQGEGILIYKEKDQAKSFRYSVFADQKTSNFRLDLYDFVFKKPLVSIVKSNYQVTAVVYFKKVYYRTIYERLDMKILTGIDIPEDILRNSLMGMVYYPENPSKVYAEGCCSIHFESNSMTQNIVFNDQLFPKNIDYVWPEHFLSINFNNYSVHDTEPFPEKIKLSSENSAVSVEINYRKLTLNGVLEKDNFNIDPQILSRYTRAYIN
ncbi:MAG: hypothetical protein ACOC7U_04925 [Spirochaetota bacterium]